MDAVEQWLGGVSIELVRGDVVVLWRMYVGEKNM